MCIWDSTSFVSGNRTACLTFFNHMSIAECRYETIHGLFNQASLTGSKTQLSDGGVKCVPEMFILAYENNFEIIISILLPPAFAMNTIGTRDARCMTCSQAMRCSRNQPTSGTEILDWCCLSSAEGSVQWRRASEAKSKWHIKP